MKRNTNQNATSPSKNAAHLLSTMSSAAENNARVRNNTLSMRDKVESARRHLKSHQRQFHTGEDSSSGESVENRSPNHHPHRSRSSPRDNAGETAVKTRRIDTHTSSVLYSAELQHVRRMSGNTKQRGIPTQKVPPRVSPSKSISPARHDQSFYDQSLHDQTITTSPRRRSTYVVAGKRDSYRGDATFTALRRETFTIDRRDETTVSHDETVIAPGLLEEEFHPRKHRTLSHGSASAFHSRCIPKDARPHEVSNPGKWDVEFLPGSLINARKIEKDRRSAAFDLVSPNAEALRYQEERTRREEEELKRLVREQTNGRSTKEIFDSWVPLDEEKRKKMDGHREIKKSTRRLWETEMEEGGEILDRLENEGDDRERRVVMEDEAGYAMPLPREKVVDRPFLRTPSPLLPRQPSPDEQFFTPIAPTPRLSRVRGVERREVGETPILGRQSTRFSSTFIFDREGNDRLRGGADEANRSVGSSFHATPDRRDESMGGGERSMGEYATPIGRREGRRRDGEENSFLNDSLNQSRENFNQSKNAFERSLNRSLDHLSSLASRLTSQLEASKANLSAIASTPFRARGGGDKLEGVEGERRLGMEASILGSLAPMGQERNSVGGDELRRLINHSNEREHRSSLPYQIRDEEKEKGEEKIERIMSPIPRPRTSIPSSHPPPSAIPSSSVHGLASLLDANIGRMERSEEYEREAQRIEGVVREINQTEALVDAVREKSVPSSSKVPPPIPPRSHLPPPLASAPLPSPRSLPIEGKNVQFSTEPAHQLSVETSGERDELVEMIGARHRNWHRRAEDMPVPSPRSAESRSPSPLPPSLWNPAALRERQSVQGMLDQRAKAVRGTFLHLLQRVYTTRYERRYLEKKSHRGDAVKEREFALEQEKEEASFRREANEAKMKAIDPNVKYREFMQWLKEESERMEQEIEFEEARKEKRRWERKMREGTIDESLLDSSRLVEANRRLDERERKALRARNDALKHLERREEVRRMEYEARRAVAFAEIPSSAGSSIDDPSFIRQARRKSIGNEPVRVTSARGILADTSMNATRDGRSRDESFLNNSANAANTSVGGDRRKEVLSEMKENLEEKRRQAEEVRRAMEESERRMNETELVSVAAQLAAHDEYIRGVERVGRVIAENVEPRSPTGLPPGVEPLDLSSLEEEEEKEEEGKRKSESNSLEKSTDISGRKDEPTRLSMSGDSLDGIPPPSIPSTAPSTQHSTSSSHSKSSTSTSSASSNKTLRATEELSQMLEEIVIDEEKKEREHTEETEKEQVVVEEKEREDTVVEELEKEDTVFEEATKEDTVFEEKEAESTVDAPQFSPLSEERHDELDRSLPSTAASTGRQELTLDPVHPRETPAVPESAVVPDGEPHVAAEIPQGPAQPVETVQIVSEEDSIPEEIVDDTVERSTVPSRALFSPIESSTTHSEDSESSSDRREVTVAGGGRNTVGQRKESIEKSTESSEETEGEEKALDVSTASLKKAISVASEMTNPFDGFESSSGGSRMGERLEAAVTTTTVSSLDQTTVVEKTPTLQRKEEEDEISWGDVSGGGLEVGGGSARSADFDWGMDDKESERKKEEQARLEPQNESIEKEEEDERPIGKISSLRDRLSKINLEEDNTKAPSTPSSSSTATSSSRSSSSKTTTSEKTSSEGTEETSGESSRRKEEKGAEDDVEKTPRVPSVSGGASSASGSIDFDDEVSLPGADGSVPSSRTPRVPSRSRFRLSLNDSFDSPRDGKSSTALLNGRVLGLASPRAITPTSPITPRAMTHSSSLASPSGAASPDGRRSRFSAVMPLSPRSGRRSTSPKNHSFSREVSFAQDDSSFGDISRLSAVELPGTTGGMSSLPPILSSLPPIGSPSLPPLVPPSRPSLGLNRSSIEEGDELDESIYDLMDVQTPVASVLSSLPIAHLIEKNEGEEISPPLTLTARSDGSSHGQYQAMMKREFIDARVEKEVDQIWKIVEEKGYFTKEDAKRFEEMDIQKEEKDEIDSIRNDRIRSIRKVSLDVAASLFARDERRTRDGEMIPKEIIPLRRLRPTVDKKKLRKAIEKELLLGQEAPVHAIRMKNLGVEFVSLPVDERILYADLYSNEENLFQSDLERGEIVEVLLKLQ